MRKLLGVVASIMLAACSGTVTGPETVVEQPQPVAATEPVVVTPQPVAPTPTPEGSELWGNGGTLYVKYRGTASRAVVETWYTSFDNQNAAQGFETATVNNGDTVSRYIGVCRQGDARIVPGKELGGVFFDKAGNPFNPTRNPEKVTECRTPEPTPTPRPSPSPTPEPTCQDQEAGAVNASVNKVTTLHAGTPAVKVGGYEFGNNSNGNRDACTDHGGTWHHQLKFCQINKLFGNTWDDDEDNLSGDHTPQSDGTWRDQFQIAAGTADKYSVVVTLSYTIAAGAAQSRTFQIVYGGSFVKKQTVVQVACGQAKQGTLVWGQGDQYNDSPNYSAGDGHVTGSYSAGIQ